MNRKILLFTTILILLLIFRCENSTKPEFKREVSVKAFISPYWKYQEIYVYYSTDSLDREMEPKEVFIRDAKVIVTGAHQKVSFHYIEDEYGSPKFIDIPDTLKVIPGERYTLRIETDVGTVTGETVVPEEIKIINPADGETFRDKTPVYIEWEQNNTLPPYGLDFLGPLYKWELDSVSHDSLSRRDFENFYSYTNSFCIDSIYIRYYKAHPNPYCKYVGEDRRYTIIVIAVDENYKEYYLNAGKSCGIENGYGFFGSAVVDSVDIFVVP